MKRSINKRLRALCALLSALCRPNQAAIFLKLLAVTIFILTGENSVAEELEMVNRPVNTSGLTGLIVTTSPFTIPSGSVEIGTGVLSESSVVPNYTVNEFPLSITAGISQAMELALRSSFVKTEGSGRKERGVGDTEVSYKWNIIPQKEYSNLPALSLIITGIAPTGNPDVKPEGVNHWGARLGVSIGSDISWRDHVLGIYADAQLAFQDLADERYRDLYGITNAGLLFPISKYRNLQLLIEYRRVSGRTEHVRTTMGGFDYTAFTSGFRLVTERFNFSVGMQYLNKDVEGYDNSGRVVGVLSMRF